jgi:hypothetical protein
MHSEHVFCFVNQRFSPLRHPKVSSTSNHPHPVFAPLFVSTDLKDDNETPAPLSPSSSSSSSKEDHNESKGSALSMPSESTSSWPCFDALDRRLIAIALPVIANFAISPLIGAVDLFWVNRMKYVKILLLDSSFVV